MAHIFCSRCFFTMLTALALGGPFAAAQPFTPPANPYPTTNAPEFYPGAPPPAVPQVPPPGGYPATSAPPLVPAVESAPTGPPSNLAPFEDAQIVVVVGDSVILAGDLMGTINQILEPYRGKAPDEELKKQAQPLMKQLAERQIETKLAYLDFMRSVPADKKGELEIRLSEQFEESQLPLLLEQYKVETAPELDAKLRNYGSSLAKMRRQFGERILAQQMIRKNVNPHEEITLDQMLAYYRAHEADYVFPAQAKWEHLMVRFDKFPDRGQAYRALAQMGNEVLRGAPLAAVARRTSQAPDADEGGQHDWTTQGSLASEVIDKALFTLPVGQMSAVLEDNQGFHIVRVLERRESGKAPFEEAQVSIKEKIRKDRLKDQTEKYIEKLRAETKVWTIYDQPVGTQAATQP